jgi:plastocyanin
MVGDNAGYRYEPSTIEARPGDGIRFVMVSAGPHNIAFDPALIPAGQKDQLWANMGENSLNGSSQMMLTSGEEWTLPSATSLRERIPSCAPRTSP